MTAEEVDALAYKLVEECVALSSDYIGEVGSGNETRRSH